MSLKQFMSEDKISSKVSFFGMVKKIWPYMMAHKIKLSWILFVVIIFSTVGRFLPMIFGYAIDEGIVKKSMSVIYWCAGGYFILEIMRAVLTFAHRLLMQKLGNRLLYEIREKLIYHVQRLPVPYFDKNPIGRTVTRVTNDVSSLGEFFTFGFTAIVVNIFEITTILIALLFISVPLTLATLLVVPILLFICFRLSQRIRIVFSAAKRKIAAINAYTAECLDGIKVIQLFHQSKSTLDEFTTHSNDYKKLQMKTVRMFATLWPILDGFNITIIGTSLLLGGLFINQLQLSVGDVSAFVLLAQSFFRPLRIILERFTQIQNSLAGADRIFTLLDQQTETLKPKMKLPIHIKGRVEFRNVSFRYSEEGPYVLKNINLVLEPGQNVALVGRTGSGKSSMISLIQKFYPIIEGDILIDGISVKDLGPEDIRKHVGLVRQDNFIFRGTLATNINLEHPNISNNMVKDSAQRANCQHLIAKSNLGLDYKVEERGSNLSVGERQLLAFARILAFDPDIFILDEATANIDSINERRIQKATDETTKGRTSLIIAHRLSTILNCDKIVLLDQGRIIEVGSHRELIAKQGPYAQLYNSQFTPKSESGEQESPLRPRPLD